MIMLIVMAIMICIWSQYMYMIVKVMICDISAGCFCQFDVGATGTLSGSSQAAAVYRPFAYLPGCFSVHIL